MTVEIRDGWLYGSLKDDKGHEWPIKRFRQPAARGRLTVETPNLCLHTTETDGYVETLRVPSQWQCGQGIIGQHIELGYAGDAVYTYDGLLQQIEMVGRSKLERWMPDEPTLGPVVALTAWLHKTGRIKTGLERPANLAGLPVKLDRGPQAVESYYRRSAPDGRGVYGHVDIKDNNHWDPGSFDYPEFFERVGIALEGEEDDMAGISDYVAGEAAFRARFRKSGDPGPAPEDKPALFRAGWTSARFSAVNPKAEASVPSGGVPPHKHKTPAGETGDVVVEA